MGEKALVPFGMLFLQFTILSGENKLTCSFAYIGKRKIDVFKRRFFLLNVFHTDEKELVVFNRVCHQIETFKASVCDIEAFAVYRISVYHPATCIYLLHFPSGLDNSIGVALF